MKLKLRCALLLALAAAAVNAGADDGVTLAQIAARLSAPLSAGTFVQHKQLAKLPLPLNSSGEFAIDARQLLWRTQTPFASDLKFDGETVSQWENGELVWSLSAREQPMVATLGQLLSALVAGDWAFIETQFALESASLLDEGCWRAQFKARDERLAHWLAQLSLAGCTAVEQVELVETGGDLTRIQLQPLP